MENNSLLTAEMLSKTKVINMHHPNIARHLSETPVFTMDYDTSKISAEELKDYNESLEAMIDHSDATSIVANGIISSHPRPDARRVLDDTLLEFDLTKEIENIKLERNWAAGNQSAKTLMKSDHIRVVLVAMHRNNQMKMHQCEGPITLQVLEGEIQFTTWKNCIIIKAGQIITLHKRIMHNLLAKEASVILITIFNVKASAKEKKQIARAKTSDEKDRNTIEQSENINFPDFPTFPAQHEAYTPPVDAGSDEIEKPEANNT